MTYDLTTLEGIRQRDVEMTNRRIPARYRDALATHPDVAAWCENFGPGCPSLLILGVTGSGKTWQAYGALRTLAATGIPVSWDAVTAPDLYARLRPRDGADPEGEMQRLMRAPLLMVDDLGAAKASEWTEEVNYRLISFRYNAMLPCLITSNVPVAQMAERLGDRVASRLNEMCVRAPLRDKDRRRAS